MAIYDIAVANDDWEVDSSAGRVDGETTLTSQWNNGVSPVKKVDAIGDIDTSGMDDGVTPSATTLYFYIDSYTASKTTTKIFTVWMLDKDDVSYTVIDNGTFTAAGWYSVALTASEIAEIDDGTGADGKTRFKITVPDPGGILVRTMETRAREYATADAWDMKLEVITNILRQLASAGVGI